MMVQFAELGPQDKAMLMQLASASFNKGNNPSVSEAELMRRCELELSGAIAAQAMDELGISPKQLRESDNAAKLRDAMEAISNDPQKLSVALQAHAKRLTTPSPDGPTHVGTWQYRSWPVGSVGQRFVRS